MELSKLLYLKRVEYFKMYYQMNKEKYQKRYLKKKLKQKENNI